MSDSPANPSFELAEGPRRFGPSARALKQRRWLLLLLKLLAFLAVGLLWWDLSLANDLDPSLRLGVLALLGGSLLLIPSRPFLRPLQQRSLLLHEQALELQRGTFRRFVVFENLKHIQAWQGRDERMIALALITADDTVLLRDLEGLGEVFALLSQVKPQGVLIEVEEKRVDWGEPLPWMLGLALGALGVLACF